MRQPKLRFKGFVAELERARLGDKYKIIMGQSPDSQSYNTEKYGVPLIQGNADLFNRETNPRQFTSQPSSKFCDIEDIIMTVRAPVGYVAKSKHKACIGRGVCAIKAPEFIYQFLLSIENKWVAISQGSTFDSVKSKDIHNINIFLPPLDEQRHIADFLSTVDRRIDLQRQLVDETRRLKTSVSQMLFSRKVRFKDDDGTDFPEWESKRLFDVGEITTGTTPSTKVRKYYGSDFLWITPTDIKNKEIKTTEKKLSKEGLAKGRRIPANSVLVTCIASIGKNCVLREEGSCNQQINAITPFNEIDVDFLYYLICFNEPLMHRYAGQGGMEMLNKEQFGNLVMDIPSFKEQLKIGKILTTLDNKIKKEENKLTELKKLKKGLLQQMFV